MVCYLNVYILTKVGSEADTKWVKEVEKNVGIESVELVKSSVVPNLLFVRFKCLNASKCNEVKGELESKLSGLPWFKVEVVCP